MAGRFRAGVALAAVAFAVGCGGSQPSTSPSNTATTPLPAPKPTPVARTGKVWPFHGWDHAEAVTFNQFPMRPDTQLHACDDNGWSPHLVICFSCGDIMLWPRWEPEQDRNMTDRQMKESLVRSAKQLELYEKVFPSWKAFFRDEIGFPIDATYH